MFEFDPFPFLTPNLSVQNLNPPLTTQHKTTVNIDTNSKFSNFQILAIFFNQTPGKRWKVCKRKKSNINLILAMREVRF